jgi:hypothetical protein
MSNTAKTEIIIGSIKKVLNSPETQAMFGSEFSKMSPEVKNDFVTVLLYKLCENDKNLFNIVAEEMYNELRAM